MDTPFAGICNEVKDMILNLLPIEDKRNARQVCQAWCSLVNWRTNFRAPFNDETANWIMKSDVLINHLTLQDFKNPLSLSSSRSSFTKSVKILAVESLINTNSTHLMNMCTDIEKLLFSTGVLMNITNKYSLRFLKFDFLNELEICVRESNKKQTRAFMELAYSANFPRLKTLFFDWDPQTVYDGRLFLDDYMAMFALISNHHKSLRILKMRVPRELSLVNMQSFDYNKEKLQAIIDKLIQVELFELSIKYTKFEGIEPFNLAIQLTDSQTKLMRFVFCGKVFPAVLRAMDQSSKTLAIVGLISTWKTHFDCRALTNCSKLRILEIFTPLAGQLLNVMCIPKSVTTFFHKGPLTPEDVVWITENLSSLEEITFINPQGNHYYFSLTTLTSLLYKTKIAKICIWCHCDTVGLSTVCSMLPGVELINLPQDSLPNVKLFKVWIDRDVLGIDRLRKD